MKKILGLFLLLVLCVNVADATTMGTVRKYTAGSSVRFDYDMGTDTTNSIVDTVIFNCQDIDFAGNAPLYIFTTTSAAADSIRLGVDVDMKGIWWEARPITYTGITGGNGTLALTLGKYGSRIRLRVQNAHTSLEKQSKLSICAPRFRW